MGLHIKIDQRTLVNDIGPKNVELYLWRGLWGYFAGVNFPRRIERTLETAGFFRLDRCRRGNRLLDQPWLHVHYRSGLEAWRGINNRTGIKMRGRMNLRPRANLSAGDIPKRPDNAAPASIDGGHAAGEQLDHPKVRGRHNQTCESRVRHARLQQCGCARKPSSCQTRRIPRIHAVKPAIASFPGPTRTCSGCDGC